MSNETLQAVRGMNDILPDEAGLWLWFEEVVCDWLHSYGYRNIRMPLVEPTALFKRAIGEATDLVGEEMDKFGLPHHPHAPGRADRVVQARHRRSDRHRREGDVQFRGLAERRRAHAAPRGNGLLRARGVGAQSAV